MNDLISREAAKEYARNHLTNPYVIHAVGYAVDSVPTVDAAPVVHGRWEKDGGVVVCSECGEEHDWETYRASYCDSCGARMDLPEGEEMRDD